MIIRIIPPQSSARSLRAMPHPKRIPNSNPIRDMAKDTKPMIEIGGSISEKSRIPRNANETPMANASILVATANASTTFKLFGSYSFAIFVLERLSDHASAQKSKNGESDPMIQTLYQMAECDGAYPPEEWHDGLK